VTGTIARTATNVRAGAHGPVAGMLHALILLGFMLLAAPLAAYIPLAALAGVLAVVAWNMIEREAIAALFRSGRGEATVLAVTFLLTVFRDLTEAILVGTALGALLFIRRMSLATEIERHTSFASSSRLPDNDTTGSGDDLVAVCRIRGAFFFGAAASVSVVLERIADTHRGLVIDLSGVPFVDSSAVATLEGIVHKAKRNGVRVMLTGTDHAMRVQLFAQGLKPPAVSYEATAEAGARKLHNMLLEG
jgi:SulP family sulfate permease